MSTRESQLASVFDRLRAKREAALPTRIQRIGRDQSSYPLSDSQERLWLIDQLYPGNVAYNITAAVRLEGVLRPLALAHSLAEIVRRHEALRTTFHAEGRAPMQIVAPAGSARLRPLDLVDLAGLGGCAPDEVERLAVEEAQTPFELGRGPLLRLRLLRLGPQEHLLLLTLHHIVGDGWSMRVLLRETRILYQAFLESRASPLPELPVQYIDFAAWQRRWLAGESAERQLAFWKRHLGELHPVLQLPTDRPRPTVLTTRGTARRLVLSRALSEQVATASRSAGVTPFLVLLAAFQILLHRLTGQPDIRVGFPIANRKRPEIQDLIGFFANTLVLRADFASAATFADLLGRLQEAAVGAYEHQDLPFGRLVKELQPERHLSHSPLFQAAFSYQNLEAPVWELPGLRLTPCTFDHGAAKFDLTLNLSETAEGLAGWWLFSTDLFDPATAARQMGHFQELLHGAVAAPGDRLSELPLLSRAERAQLLVEWADRRAPGLGDLCLHELFESRAARAPEELAVRFQDETLTFRELEERSGRLAARLQRLGVGPEVPVALCLERSLDVVAAVLGVLRAGGAFVPLDPQAPGERLAGLLEDCGARALLTQERLLARFPAEWSARSLCLDGPCGEEARPAAAGTVPSNLCYVLYTSGSTGRPKGVMVQHRSAVNLVAALRQAVYGEPERPLRVAVNAPLFFDGSIKQVLQLLSGHALDILPEEVRLDAEVLPAYLQAHGVDAFDCTPSQLRLLRAGNAALPALVLVGGEALEAAEWEALAADPRTTFHNVYGPTECTVDTTARRITAGKPTIGRPVVNAAVYLLDRSGQPVGIGVPGQLHVGGAGLARGYLGRPDLTAERFLPDPFSGEPGARLYASGDLARHRPDSEIEFLGRVDHQVKVRGVRIEPGEIESALLGLPGVAAAVVVAREDRPGDRRLAAYITAGGGALDPAQLRRLLIERLPETLVPSVFVVLDRLPLTPNGKVDRGALPAPETGSGEALVAPRTPVEELVAGIFAEVLGRGQVGVEEGFFELGGHSLLATQVVSRLRQVLAVEMPLRSLFERPTVRAIAAELGSQTRNTSSYSALVPIAKRTEYGNEPLSFGQQRLWFLHQLDRQSAAYHMPVVLRLTGELAPAPLAAALEGVVRRHEVLRTTFELRPGGPVQVIAPATAWRLPVIDLSRLGPAREAESERLIVAEANRLFDLVRGPLLRTSLLRLGPADHVLLLVVHHIASDAWSMALLWREILALYQAAVAGGAAPEAMLPPLPIQYADFAVWQRAQLSGERLSAELAHWRGQLAGAPALLELPADRPRPPVQSFRGGRHRVSLPAATTRGLAAFGQREGATLFMVVLTAFDVLLARSSRQHDIVVGAPVAGRNRIETEGLIGLFLNTLALRVDTSGPVSGRDLLRRVREVTLAAYAHQDLPFEKLVAELDLERNIAHAPLFQVLLTFQNPPAAPVAVPGLDVRVLDVGTGTSKFDLILNVSETAEGLAGWWLFSTDLFDPATAARLLGHFQQLLAGILVEPGRPISELPLLGAAERHQLLAAWNDTALALQLDRPFAELFEEQAARSPDACAIACGEQELSYGELDRRANRLARALGAAGAGPEVPVAVLAPRGAELLTAMLAIWKAGGAYLPLDPNHPPSRLLQALEQSGSPLLLVTDELLPQAAGLGADGALAWRTLAMAQLLRDGLPDAPLPPRAFPAQLAYVLFTSGSTGVPKGVMIEQRSMLNHLWTMVADLGLAPADRVAQTALQTFDISIWQFLAALLVGGSIDVLPDELIRDPQRLLEDLEGRAITVFEPVPSLLTALLQVEAQRRPTLAALRWLLPTGEALMPALCRQWFDAYPAVPLVNAYGPTECADDVTLAFLRQPLPDGAARAPIGRPVANTRVYVLDSAWHPAPIGVPGELAVGGVQVGRGYWRRPELTADRFVPDPFCNVSGARLYRTGDLARWRPAGELEFLGRIDHQVKVRGFRIELGDIEAALARHAAVREAVVLARQDRDGRDGLVDQRLVAYFVAAPDAEIALPELRQFLLASLPEYMIPAAFVVLPAFPLTANGKIDRKALPAPEVDETRATQGFVAPRTDLERALAGLWAEVLGIAADQVGVHDPFFEVGGNSILAAVLINRLQKTLGEIVHVVALFDHSTVAALAEYLLRDYAQAVARIWGLVADGQAAAGRSIDAEQVARLRTLVPPRRAVGPDGKKNPPAAFVLSAPRSGSTLLRVMLAGHSRLFAPPELELLSFDDMAERRAAFAGRNAFWLEGLIRGVMEIHCCSPEAARELVERAEAEALPTSLFYRRLQQWLGDRILVDKSSAYCLNRTALDRAEAEFDGALYLHLIRDPRAMIHSFEEAKLDQVFFPHPHSFNRRELAELIWVVSHQNAVQFLAGVPRERQHWVRFEELVRDPHAVLGGICDFLGLPFHSDMAEPYKHVETRMADGLHAESRMLGDVKFLQHDRIDAAAAERWRQARPDVPLGEPTHELAAELGYQTRTTPSHPALVPITAGEGRRPLFLVHPIGGGVFWYLPLARQLGEEQPVYGLRAMAEAKQPDLAALARGYLEAVREIQPAGPYHLGGWSMGAVVAYEMARQLHDAGEEVASLAMIDPPAPRTVPAGTDDEATLLAGLVGDLEGLSGKSLGRTLEELAELAPEERLERVLAACQTAGMLPAHIEPGQFRELFTIFRQNRHALRTYVPGSYAGALSLFLARGTTAVPSDPVLAWGELAAGGADVHVLAADHYSLLQAPAIDRLAGQLRRSLGLAS